LALTALTRATLMRAVNDLVARDRGLACRSLDLRCSGDTAGLLREVGHGSFVLLDGKG